jgi:hypothetical protein
MKYQLVIQFEARSLDEFNDLVTFEEALRGSIGDSSFVDGHDFGGGELNIFVLTDDPASAFLGVQQVARITNLGRKMKAAYRDPMGDKYHLLWPPDLMEFKVS